MPVEGRTTFSARDNPILGPISPFERRFERRFFSGRVVEAGSDVAAPIVRDWRGSAGRFLDPASPTSVGGYASIFGSRSQLLHEHGEEFYEVIAAGAFIQSLLELEPSLLLRHNPKQVLAQSPDTLGVEEDETGLAFSASLAGSELARQTAQKVKSGELKGCSIGFVVPLGGCLWEQPQGPNTPLLRTITRAELHEISIVDRPAYKAPHVRDDRAVADTLSGLPPLTIIALSLLKK